MSWRLDGFGHASLSLSDATRSVYRRDLDAFVAWAGAEGIGGPEGVRRVDLRRYLASLSGVGPGAGTALASRTIRRKVSALRRYFGWLAAEGVVGADPTSGLAAPRGDRRPPRVLTADQLVVLLEEGSALDEHPARRLRDDAVLELLYGSGVRVSELCGLDLD